VIGEGKVEGVQTLGGELAVSDKTSLKLLARELLRLWPRTSAGDAKRLSGADRERLNMAV
jgi:hypothetical protein